MQSSLSMPSVSLHRTPASIFISYAREDQYFVDLLVELLRVHRLQPWHDKHMVTPMRGKPRVMDHVLDGIRSSDAFVLVASPHAESSVWVRHELQAFVHNKEEPFIIPVVIAPCEIERVHTGLEEMVCLEFYRDMLGSFKQLMATIGCEWLPLIDQRTPRGERRQAQPYDRLEFALCQVVRRKRIPLTQALPFEEQAWWLSELLEGFHVEIRKGYRLLDQRHPEVEVELTALKFRDAMLNAIEGRSLAHLVPAFLVKAVVAELGLRYRFEGRDRRKPAAVPAGRDAVR